MNAMNIFIAFWQYFHSLVNGAYLTGKLQYDEAYCGQWAAVDRRVASGCEVRDDQQLGTTARTCRQSGRASTLRVQ